ncbi:MAG: GNAT family N-acetyltransferase [Acidimicrobiales bacterium]
MIPADWNAWKELRVRNRDWLGPWESLPPANQTGESESRAAFASRCSAREREWQLGTGYGFGLFLPRTLDPAAPVMRPAFFGAAEETNPGTPRGALGHRNQLPRGPLPRSQANKGRDSPWRGGRLSGEINISCVQRGPFQNAYVGYWIDEAVAGRGYMPEALALALEFAFENLGLHRVQVAIIPRNGASRRVVDKLAMRAEGVAQRYLAINGVWEDHIRYAMTSEEWVERRAEIRSRWIESGSTPVPAVPRTQPR